VLLDLMLPGMDGLAVCRELRKLGDVPILIFTARDTDLNQVIGLEAGADDYVTKPVDPDRAVGSRSCAAAPGRVTRRRERWWTQGHPAGRAAHQRECARGLVA